ncbi:hypothetical protein JVU11DRAFT_603 [Chiua virens]|nr:hypothetical protein JVU11DRAFT_603 [Chiua virens]
MSSSLDWECDSIASSSSCSSDSSIDDDQLNARLSPHWSKYRDLILSKGYGLDTVRDVKEHYRRHGASAKTRVLLSADDNALCRDPGLVCNDSPQPPMIF